MNAFKEGYDAFIRIHSSNLATLDGAEYVGDIEVEIEKLLKAINDPTRKIHNTSDSTLKGFMAEWWHAGTFNINAAVKGLDTRAAAPDDNGLIDILIDGKEGYSLKYYKTGSDSAAEQAKTNLQRFNEYANHYRRTHEGAEPPKTLAEYLKENHPNDPYYLGQGRLIPKNQMEEATAWLQRKMLEEANGGRAEQVKRYQEVLDKLTDRIKSADGAESIPLTNDEALKLAKLAKEARFDPAKWGLMTKDLIEFQDIMRQAGKAGISAALISVVLKVAPEVIGIIMRYIKEGVVELQQFKKLGLVALKGGTEGYIRGTFAASISIAIKAGKFGAKLKQLSPNIIGAVVALTLNSVQNACMMSFGMLSKHDFANRCAQDLVVAAFTIGGGVAGAALLSFNPALAILGSLIGSFVGSTVGGFVYNGIYKCTMSYIVESGSTFFGLVEQNYEIPKDVLESIGVNVFDYEHFMVKKFVPDTFSVIRFEYDKLSPLKVDVKLLRRGVMRVGVVGYV